MIVFVINLHNRPERFYNTLKNLEKIGLNNYVIRKNACTPQRAKKDFPKYINEKAFININNIKSTCIIPTWGSVACIISHFEIYEYIIRNKIQKAIIIEDDFEIDNLIKFKMYYNEGLNILKKNTQENNLNLTFINYNAKIKNIKHVHSYRYWGELLNYDYNYLTLNNNTESKREILNMPFIGTQFYMINYNMAIQLTSKLLPFTYQLDLQIGVILYDIFKECNVVWNNLSNITFYNYKNCGIIQSKKFKSDIQYYFPNINDLKNINYFNKLDLDIIKYIISFTIQKNHLENEYLYS